MLLYGGGEGRGPQSPKKRLILSHGMPTADAVPLHHQWMGGWMYSNARLGNVGIQWYSVY